MENLPEWALEAAAEAMEYEGFCDVPEEDLQECFNLAGLLI